MSDLPKNLKYAVTHEWVKLEENNTVRIGITDFAQTELGDLVYIELPDIGKQLTLGEQCAVVESVKTASDLFSPVTGTIVAVNKSLEDAPEQVNNAAYDSWLFCIKVDDPTELEKLMNADAYQKMIGD